MALLLDSFHSMPFLASTGRLSDHVVLLCNYGHEINHIKNSEASTLGAIRSCKIHQALLLRGNLNLEAIETRFSCDEIYFDNFFGPA